MAIKFHIMGLCLLLFCVSCTKDRSNTVSVKDDIETENITLIDNEKSNTLEEVQKKSKQDINGNIVFNNKTWSPGNKDGVSNIQFSGNLNFYNLNIKDTEDEAKKKINASDISFENINYLDDGLRTYRVVGLLSENNIFTIGYYNKEFAMCSIENLSLQECQNIANDLFINCDISILENNEFFEFYSDSLEIYFSYYEDEYKFEVFDTLKEP